MKTASPPWPLAAVVVLFLTAALLALYWPTAVSIVRVWASSDTYSHGFLIVPLSLYIAWSRRARLASLQPSPAFWTLPLFFLLDSSWLLGQLSATDIVQQFSMAAMLAVAIWGAIGNAAARAMLFPLSLLFFAVPAGQELIPVLQDFSAWSAVKLLDLSGVPVVLQEHFITVPFGKWEVAEACAGMHTLIACFVFGYVYAGLAYRSWPRRAAFVTASAIAPIVANGMRIWAIVALGYFAGDSVAAATHHLLAGWVFALLVMMILLAAGLRWRDAPDAGSTRANESPRTGEAAAASAPAIARSNSTWRMALFAVLAVALAGFAPIYATYAWKRAADAEPIQLVAPGSAAPWHVSNREPHDWQPSFVTTSAELRRTYSDGDREVGLYIAYFGAGQQGAKLVSSSNALFDKQRWRRIREGNIAVSCEGQSFRARETAIHSPESALVLWSWYWVDGTFTGDRRLAKYLLAKARLLRSPRGSAAIVLATTDSPARPAAKTLRDFAARVSLQEMLTAGNATAP